MVSVVLVCVALDQLSKALVMACLERGQQVVIVPKFFNLTLHFNKGAAFGLFSNLADGQRQVAITVTTLLALGCVVFLLIKDYLSDPLGQTALAMVFGGALGNIVDRLRFGEVVDFLDFHYAGYHWPAFNLADSLICIGVLILLFKRPSGRQEKKEKVP